MKEPRDEKMYYFFDESGSPEILGRKGVNLVNKGTTSKVFMVGFISTTSPRTMNYREAEPSRYPTKAAPLVWGS